MNAVETSPDAPVAEHDAVVSEGDLVAAVEAWKLVVGRGTAGFVDSLHYSIRGKLITDWQEPLTSKACRPPNCGFETRRRFRWSKSTWDGQSLDARHQTRSPQMRGERKS